MEKSISCTIPSPEDSRQFLVDYKLLFEARIPTEIAAIYDRILERLSTLLVPRKEKGDEYFDDQKFLYYAIVREIMASPDTELARQRFKQELEDFFSKKPSFRWK